MSRLSSSLGELFPAARLLSRLPSRPLPPPVLLRDFSGETLYQCKSSVILYSKEEEEEDDDLSEFYFLISLKACFNHSPR
jgi:hypothetical protein